MVTVFAHVIGSQYCTKGIALSVSIVNVSCISSYMKGVTSKAIAGGPLRVSLFTMTSEPIMLFANTAEMSDASCTVSTVGAAVCSKQSGMKEKNVFSCCECTRNNIVWLWICLECDKAAEMEWCQHIGLVWEDTDPTNWCSFMSGSRSNSFPNKWWCGDFFIAFLTVTFTWEIGLYHDRTKICARFDDAPITYSMLQMSVRMLLAFT